MKLYYSLRCQHCKTLISIIQQNATLANNIEAVDIMKNEYPRELSRVPTIIKDGRQYIGREAFMLVKESEPTNVQNNTQSKNDAIMGMEMGTGYEFIHTNKQKGCQFGVGQWDLHEPQKQIEMKEVPNSDLETRMQQMKDEIKNINAGIKRV